jgi:hypothetical protein
VGRREQVLFARRSAERMKQLVESRLRRGSTEPAPSSPGGIVGFPTRRLR